MLIDLHAHSSKISKCCQTDAEGAIKIAREVGLDGIVLTNHYQKSYISNGDVASFADRYVREYYDAKEIGDRLNMKVFFGIEVTAELYPGVHILIYGVGEEFIRQNLEMYDYTQKLLYERVKEFGGAMIQAHPFRNGTSIIDTEYLDGIEINCHPLYKKSFSEEIQENAGKYNLTVTCGGDFHADTYRPKCGVYLPDTVGNSCELSEYILNAENVRMCVHEPDESNPKEILYIRT